MAGIGGGLRDRAATWTLAGSRFPRPRQREPLSCRPELEHHAEMDDPLVFATIFASLAVLFAPRTDGRLVLTLRLADDTSLVIFL